MFTWNGDWALAYQVVGEGPDLVYLPPFIGSVDQNWLFAPYARFLDRLASFSRLIVMDRRGWGVSDRLGPSRAPTLDDLVDDLFGVMDAANARRPTLFAAQESGFHALEAVASHPDRFSRLVLYQCSPSWNQKDDMPWEETAEEGEANLGSLQRSVSWDDWVRNFVRDQLPSLEGDRAALTWVADASRALGAPGGVIADMRWMSSLDLRDRLGSIRVPTLAIGREGVASWPIESVRYLADKIPDATLRVLAGADLYPWIGDWEAVTDEVQEFVTGSRERPAPRRGLTTVLFTDVVGSTVQAVELGDGPWHELLARHNDVLRDRLRRHHGTEVGTTGDGFFATFDSAAEAVRCALAMTDDVRQLGIEIRAGVHTGEVEFDGDDLRGIAVHIGARVMSLAGSSEVWVSSTVKDLSGGAGLAFEEAGEHELKGVPDPWRLYRVIGAGGSQGR
jgi:class 3 adenylate cyclase